jgi:transcriptional regulator with GAF, ATPase, and Fis domain
MKNLIIAVAFALSPLAWSEGGWVSSGSVKPGQAPLPKAGAPTLQLSEEERKERAQLETALEQNAFDEKKAAIALKMDPQTLAQKMKKYEFKLPAVKPKK